MHSVVMRRGCALAHWTWCYKVFIPYMNMIALIVGIQKAVFVSYAHIVLKH